MKRNLLLQLTILCLALSLPAFADLYNNGATNGNAGSTSIDTFVVSNSFVPTSNGHITSFTFAEWVPPTSTPIAVDWAIGTSSFGSNLGSGTAAAISFSVFCFAGPGCGGGTDGFDVYLSTVNVGSIAVTAGQTYWLSLTNATDTCEPACGGGEWDINGGPSLAYSNKFGSIASESFTINGTPTGSTPEPASIMLFGSGILGLAGILRRKLS